VLFQPYWINRNKAGVAENKGGILSNLAEILGLKTRTTDLEAVDVAYGGRLTSLESTTANNTGRIVTLEEDANGFELDITGLNSDVSALQSGKANTSGTYAGLRAQATTKADVGLGSVANFSYSTSYNYNSDSHYATAGAVRDLYQYVLGAINGGRGVNASSSASYTTVWSGSATDAPYTPAPGIYRVTNSVGRHAHFLVTDAVDADGYIMSFQTPSYNGSFAEGQVRQLSAGTIRIYFTGNSGYTAVTKIEKLVS
jgi:hypothetical protein